MIVLALVLSMAAPAAQPVAPVHERQALGACLAKFVHDKLSDKMEAAAFKTAAHAACAPQEAAFRSAWTNYYVGMNTKRSEAEEIAGSQADDYFQNETDSYASSLNPAPAKAAGGAAPAAQASSATAVKPSPSPVTPASSTTPPKP